MQKARRRLAASTDCRHTVSGTISLPSHDSSFRLSLTATSAVFKNATFTTLYTPTGRIGALTATTGSFLTSAHIPTLTVNALTATTISAPTSGHITTLTTNALTATTANAGTGHITTLTATSVSAGHMLPKADNTFQPAHG